MRSSLLAEPTNRNIKTVDLAKIAEIPEIAEIETS